MQDTGSPTHIGESLGTEEGARLQGASQHGAAVLNCACINVELKVANGVLESLFVKTFQYFFTPPKWSMCLMICSSETLLNF